jgi:hypothetical protein
MTKLPDFVFGPAPGVALYARYGAEGYVAGRVIVLRGRVCPPGLLRLD